MPRLVTESGIVTLLRLGQLLKAASPILVTELGIVTLTGVGRPTGMVGASSTSSWPLPVVVAAGRCEDVSDGVAAGTDDGGDKGRTGMEWSPSRRFTLTRRDGSSSVNAWVVGEGTGGDGGVGAAVGMDGTGAMEGGGSGGGSGTGKVIGSSAVALPTP